MMVSGTTPLVLLGAYASHFPCSRLCPLPSLSLSSPPSSSQGQAHQLPRGCCLLEPKLQSLSDPGPQTLCASLLLTTLVGQESWGGAENNSKRGAVNARWVLKGTGSRRRSLQFNPQELPSLRAELNLERGLCRPQYAQTMFYHSTRRNYKERC